MTGDGTTGAALAAHPGIDGLSFTGSPAAGRKVAIAGAAGFKKTVLELGGKSPTIVFDDADLEQAARPPRGASSSTPVRCAAPAPGCWCIGASPRSSAGGFCG